MEIILKCNVLLLRLPPPCLLKSCLCSIFIKNVFHFLKGVEEEECVANEKAFFPLFLLEKALHSLFRLISTRESCVVCMVCDMHFLFLCVFFYSCMYTFHSFFSLSLTSFLFWIWMKGLTHALSGRICRHFLWREREKIGMKEKLKQNSTTTTLSTL